MLVKGGRDSTCVRCEQVDDLFSVMKLMEEVERLRSTRECEQKIDWIELDKKTLGGYTEMVLDILPCHHRAEGRNLWKEWKQVPDQHHRQPPFKPTLVPQVPLCNRFEVLKLKGEISEDVVGGPPLRLSRVRQSSPCLKTTSAKKDRRVVIIGDFWLRGTEGPVCQPDPICREVCCLPGARVRVF